MGLLRRLFGGTPTNCEMCGHAEAEYTLRLPDGTMPKVCRTCRGRADEVFDKPLYDFQFEEMFETLSASEDGIWMLRWGTTREEVLHALPPDLRSEFANSRSERLLRAEVALAGHSGFLTLTFDDGRLCEAMLAPKKAVVDAYAPLRRRYGEPRSSPPGFSPGEKRYVWQVGGIEVDLSEPPNRVISVVVRHRRRWT